jgi:hypothetical protein
MAAVELFVYWPAQGAGPSEQLLIWLLIWHFIRVFQPDRCLPGRNQGTLQFIRAESTSLPSEGKSSRRVHHGGLFWPPFITVPAAAACKELEDLRLEPVKQGAMEEPGFG